MFSSHLAFPPLARLARLDFPRERETNFRERKQAFVRNWEVWSGGAPEKGRKIFGNDIMQIRCWNSREPGGRKQEG